MTLWFLLGIFGEKFGRISDDFMNKRKYRKIVLNLITITILLTILYLVFRKDYKAILNCVSKISLLNLLLLLGMGICYQLLDAAVCFTKLRRI